MGKYKVIYDVEDEHGRYALEEELDTWEEAQEFREALLESPDCCNIQIIDMDFE